MKDLDLYVTLWPTFDHFDKFATDYRLNGIRLNSAMIHADTIKDELETVKNIMNPVPLYLDVKGRQLRVTKVENYDDHLELELNHPIKVRTPCTVLFKAGEDYAELDRVVDNKRLIFNGGPEYFVYEGESLHIRDPSLKVGGYMFCENEIEKIIKAREVGFNKFFLSYVESQDDIDEFRNYVGDSMIVAKIENKKGLEYVEYDYKKQDNLSLMAARGDMYVEVDRPHHILEGMKTIINKDPEAFVGSRLLLSTIDQEVPRCADFSDLAWLYDIGYRKMMLCDEICLKEDLLTRAVNVFESFKMSYANDKFYVNEITSRIKDHESKRENPGRLHVV
ncbi:pyruvate kinase [Nanoarchaeota archaeon]